MEVSVMVSGSRMGEGAAVRLRLQSFSVNVLVKSLSILVMGDR